jgi:hypothetical protein
LELNDAFFGSILWGVDSSQHSLQTIKLLIVELFEGPCMTAFLLVDRGLSPERCSGGLAHMELSAIVGRKSKFDVIDGVAIVETVIDSGDLFDGREIAGEVIT